MIDLLRRAGEEVELVSIHNKDMTQGSHGIGIKNDVMLKDIFVDAADTLFLPGGGVGTKNLKACEELSKLLTVEQQAAISKQNLTKGTLEYAAAVKSEVAASIESQTAGC